MVDRRPQGRLPRRGLGALSQPASWLVLAGWISATSLSCAGSPPSCAVAADCSAASSCHLGRCRAALVTPDPKDKRVVLHPTELYFSSDDRAPDGAFDPGRNAALYLAFPPLPRGLVDAAFLNLPLVEDAPEPLGTTSVSLASILVPWTSRDAARAGAPPTSPALERLRVRPARGSLRLDVTAFLQRAEADRKSTPNVGPGSDRDTRVAGHGFAVRAENVRQPVSLSSGTDGNSLPTLDVYLR